MTIYLVEDLLRDVFILSLKKKLSLDNSSENFFKVCEGISKIRLLLVLFLAIF